MGKITCERLLEAIKELSDEVEKISVLDKERRLEVLEKFHGVVTNLASVVKNNTTDIKDDGKPLTKEKYELIKDWLWSKEVLRINFTDEFITEYKNTSNDSVKLGYFTELTDCITLALREVETPDWVEVSHTLFSDDFSKGFTELSLKMSLHESSVPDDSKEFLENLFCDLVKRITTALIHDCSMSNKIKNIDYIKDGIKCKGGNNESN